MANVFQLRSGVKPLTFRSFGTATYMVGMRRKEMAFELASKLSVDPKIQYKHVSYIDMDASLHRQLCMLGVGPEKFSSLRFSKGVLLIEKELNPVEVPHWHVFASHLYTYAMYPIEKKYASALVNAQLEDAPTYSSFDVFIMEPTSS